MKFFEVGLEVPSSFSSGCRVDEAAGGFLHTVVGETPTAAVEKESGCRPVVVVGFGRLGLGIVGSVVEAVPVEAGTKSVGKGSGVVAGSSS